MDMLKKIFPLSFRFSSSVVELIIGILVYLVVGAVAGFVIYIASLIPVVNLLCGLAGGLVDIYCLAGIVIEVLVFLNILK